MPGCARLKRSSRGASQSDASAGRCGDRHNLAGSGNTLDHGVQLRKRLVSNAIQLFAGRSQLQRAVHSSKERLTELFFERLDLAADR